MMRLAALFIVIAAIPASAENCPVPMHLAPTVIKIPPPLNAEDPACVNAVSLVPHFQRLAAFAGFAPGQLTLSILVGSGEENARYWLNSITLDDSYLRRHPREAPVFLVTISHEIGHAVQERDGDRAWVDQETRAGRYLSASRRAEAHADAIGQRLLLLAGYPPIQTRAAEQRFGCNRIAATEDDPSWRTHPEDRDRWANGIIAQRRVIDSLPAERRAALERLAGGGAETLDAAFTGALLRGGQDPALPARGPVRFESPYRITDFDNNGRLMPGRLASSDLRLRPPPPDASFDVQASYVIAQMVSEPVAMAYGAVVDWWYTRQTVSGIAVNSCGAVLNGDYDGTVLKGAGEAAAAATTGTLDWLLGTPSPPPPPPLRGSANPS